MRIGMLWADFSKEDFVTKCNRAIAYYESKYGVHPTAIVVHPSMMQNIPIATEDKPTAIVENITFRTSRSVLPNHFWIGQED